MNRNTLVVEDPADRPRGHPPQMRAALSQAVEEFGQHLAGRNQADVTERVPCGDDLGTVLIVGMKYCAPVERVRENRPHFFPGALWR